MTLTETCACGASLTTTARYDYLVERQAHAFREAHAVCRKPPTPPPTPRTRLYRVSRTTP